MPSATDPPDRVLAEWTIAPYEWRAYYHGEASEKRLGALYWAVIGAIPGAMVAGLFSMEWRYLAVGAVLPGLAVLAWMLLSAVRLQRREPSAGGGVVVRRDRVEIDGATTVLRDGSWWLAGAKVRDDLPLPVLELSLKKVYEQGHTRRTLLRTVRVPVPRGHESDARRVAEELAPGKRNEDGE